MMLTLFSLFALANLIIKNSFTSNENPVVLEYRSHVSKDLNVSVVINETMGNNKVLQLCYLRHATDALQSTASSRSFECKNS